jgi:hypothetical protein
MPLPSRGTKNVKSDGDFETVEKLKLKSYGQMYLNFLKRVFLSTFQWIQAQHQNLAYVWYLIDCIKKLLLVLALFEVKCTENSSEHFF